jgi:hypothetical protein
MRKAVAMLVVFLMVVAVAGAWGQETMKPSGPKPPDLNAAYKLDYVMAELEDGKRVNTRVYTVLTDDGGEGKLNQGVRVPIMTGEKSMQYIDIGLHINAKVRSREDNTVWLSTRFELSGLIDQVNAGSSGAPTMRTVEYATPTVLMLGKSTVLASGDDLGSKKKFELSVTVTKLR